MPRFYIELDTLDRPAIEQEFADVAAARSAALIILASELQTNPNFAAAGHWRADIRDGEHRLLAHVIVATVIAAPPINWASY